MPTSKDLLQFHYSPTTLKHLAQRVIPISLNELVENRINKLDTITKEVGSRDFQKKGSNLIPQVFKKFKRSINVERESFELGELRTLTYSLTYSERNLGAILSRESELEIALEILEANWRDYFLLGLIDCLLSNWETIYRKSLEQLEQFIIRKLDNYIGNRSTLNLFKSNKRYFNTKNGDLILGDTMAKLFIPIQNVERVIGVPESWFTYSYFSKVIVTYYERNKTKITSEIDNLNEALLKNKSLVTNKRLISKLIIEVNHLASMDLQDKVKKMAFNLIGDPSDATKWRVFDGAVDVEKREIIQARGILNVWITQQFINVFFNVCINDERRKRFWLRLASKISSFKVYGPEHTKSILKRDERIAEYVDARFETFISKRDISAFILYIGNHMLIEFSVDGYASIAYKMTSKWKPSLNHKLNSADDLRNSSMQMAIESGTYSDYYNDEGRLFHKDGKSVWETKFNNWISQIVLK